MMTILVVASAATWAMVGVIWVVQLVQYPMLAAYSVHAPGTAAADHQRRISWVVGPLMATEGVTALILLFEQPEHHGRLQCLAGRSPPEISAQLSAMTRTA